MRYGSRSNDGTHFDVLFAIRYTGVTRIQVEQFLLQILYTRILEERLRIIL